jgi:hypothetical protein
MRPSRLLPFAAFVPALSACSTSSSPDDGQGQAVVDAGPFVAYVSDFSGFHSWSSTPGVGPDGAPQPPSGPDGGIHVGPLTTYINHKPPSGSTSFPVGTVIVKEPDTGALTDRQIFAMAKRGGGYDSSGMVGWELFELRNVDANTVTILWRGLGPPAGEAYGTSIEVCSDCHAGAQRNDYVWTEGLELSSF